MVFKIILATRTKVAIQETRHQRETGEITAAGVLIRTDALVLLVSLITGAHTVEAGNMDITTVGRGSARLTRVDTQVRIEGAVEVQSRLTNTGVVETNKKLFICSWLFNP